MITGYNSFRCTLTYIFIYKLIISYNNCLIYRFEIIKKLAIDNDIQFEEEALKYIARNFSNNVRELEGAFTKVCAYAEITEQELTLKLAQEVLKCDEKDEEVSFDKIARVTASYFDVDINDIKGTARGQKVSIARHI